VYDLDPQVQGDDVEIPPIHVRARSAEAAAEIAERELRPRVLDTV